MTIEERLVEDFAGTGVTVGRHPMAFHRAALQQRGVLAACELARLPHGQDGADRRIGDCPPASRHRQRVCLSQH